MFMCPEYGTQLKSAVEKCFNSDGFVETNM